MPQAELSEKGPTRGVSPEALWRTRTVRPPPYELGVAERSSFPSAPWASRG